MTVRRRPPVIGLTGGIGAGKSAVAEMLERLGAVVSDSDRDTAEILRSPDVVEIIRGWWGDGVVDDHGKIVRTEVARRVFSDPAERLRLEGLIHPRVHDLRRRRFEEAADSVRMFVIDAPLLFEAGLEMECDAVWFVDASEDLRRNRVEVHRNWDGDELARRESNQLSIEEKRRRSDVVLENDGSLDELRARVEAAFSAACGDDPTA